MTRMHLPRAWASIVVFPLTLGLSSCTGGGGSAGSQVPSQALEAAKALDPTPVESSALATREVAKVTWNLILGEPQTLDSSKVVNYGDQEVMSNLCEPLEYLKPDGTREPALAQSIEEKTPTDWMIRIRPGVKFWDGSALTAEDVAFSMNRIRDPKNASFYAGLSKNVQSITAQGTDTVEVRLSQPDEVYRQALVTPLGVVNQKRAVEKDEGNYGTPQGGLMCTGPYKLTKWSSGTAIDLERNDSWWNAATRKQWPGTATFRFTTDPQNSTSALSAGEIDGEFSVPPAALRALTTTQAGTLLTGPSTEMIGFATLNHEGAIGSVQIRQAITQLIDYDGYVKSQYLNTAVPSRALAGPNTWAGAQAIYKDAYRSLPEAKQNLEGARKLVQDSGIAHPKVRIATYNGLPQEAALVQQLQSDAKSVGLAIEFDNLPLADFTTLYSSVEARNKYDLMMQFTGADIPNALEFYQSVALENGVNNLSGYSNPEVTKLLAQAAQAGDPKAAAVDTVKAQEIVTREAPWIPVVFPNFTVFLNKRLTGATASFPTVMYRPWLPDIGLR